MDRSDLETLRFWKCVRLRAIRATIKSNQAAKRRPDVFR
jgi:hypothetical protein